MSTKEKEIQEWLACPVHVGDSVAGQIPYIKKETVTTGRGKSKKVETIDHLYSKSFSGTVKDIVSDVHGRIVYVMDGHGSWSIPHEATLSMPADVSKKYGYAQYVLAIWCQPVRGHSINLKQSI